MTDVPPLSESTAERLWLVEKLVLGWLMLVLALDPAWTRLPQAWTLLNDGAGASPGAFASALGALRLAAVGGAAAAFAGAARAVLLPFVAGAFLLLSWASQSLGGAVWNYNLHLAWFLVLLRVADVGASPAAARARTLSLMQLAVALFYLQSGLSKLVGSGAWWFLEGTAIHHYAPTLGTALGRLLAGQPGLCRCVGLATGVLEFALPVLLLVPRTQRLAAVAAWGFHAGVFLVFGIGFWQLQILYVALFFRAPALAMHRLLAAPPPGPVRPATQLSLP